MTEILVGMGYSRGEIEESLSQAKYDDIFATYLLLGRKSNDVSTHVIGKYNLIHNNNLYVSHVA